MLQSMGLLRTGYSLATKQQQQTTLWGSWAVSREIVQFSPVQFSSVQFSSVQSLSRVQLFATPWTAARQASLSITNSRSLPKLMSIELVMPSNHLILCHPLLLPLSIFPSIRVFSNESVLRIRWPKYWSFSVNINPSNDSAVARYKKGWAKNNNFFFF